MCDCKLKEVIIYAKGSKILRANQFFISPIIASSGYIKAVSKVTANFVLEN